MRYLCFAGFDVGLERDIVVAGIDVALMISVFYKVENKFNLVVEILSY